MVKKLFILIGIVLAGFVIYCLGAMVLLFNEFSTATNFEVLYEEDETYIYYTSISGNYYFNDLENGNGAWCTDNIEDLVNNNTSLPLIPTKEIAIEYVDYTNKTLSFTAQNEDKEIESYYACSNSTESNSILILETDKTDSYKSISVVDLGYFGVTESLDFFGKIVGTAGAYFPTTGMNEKGLIVSLEYIDDIVEEVDYTNTELMDITENILARSILDNCATIEEAQALIKEYDLYLSFNKHFSLTLTDNSKSIKYTSQEVNYLNKNFIDLYYETIEINSNNTQNIVDTYNRNNIYFTMFNISTLSIDFYFNNNTEIDKTITL